MATWRCTACGYQSLAAPDPGSPCPRCGGEISSPRDQAIAYAKKNPPKPPKPSWWDRFKSMTCTECGARTTGLEKVCPNCGGPLKDSHSR